MMEIIIGGIVIGSGFSIYKLWNTYTERNKEKTYEKLLNEMKSKK